MKKTDIEKQLQKDLSASTPSDFDAVWNKCTTPASEEKELIPELVPATAHNGKSASAPSRKTISVAAIITAFLLCLAAILCITLLKKSGNGYLLPSQSGYFIIDVNPSLRIDYDKRGVVTSARGLNPDGEALIDGLSLDGLTYDKATDAVFDRCVSNGYFSTEYDDNAILVTASKESGEKDEQMTEEINKLLKQKFEDKKMSGVVISDVDNSKGQKEAEKYGISGQKYELIARYIDMGGSLDESQYATVTIRELYSLMTKLDKTSKDKN